MNSPDPYMALTRMNVIQTMESNVGLAQPLWGVELKDALVPAREPLGEQASMRRSVDVWLLVRRGICRWL
jgi:hypothetical protein